MEGDSFQRAGVEVEKDLHRQRIENLINDKAAYAGDRTIALMCKDESFGVPRLGYADRVENITSTGLYHKYKEILRDATVHLYAVGNFTSDQFEALALRAFSPLAEMRFTAVETAVKAPTVSPVEKPIATVVEQMDVQQGVLCVGLRSTVLYQDDMYPALLVYNGILGGFPHSKLFVNVREKASLAYYASSRMYGLKGILLIQSGIQIENYEQAKAIILEQIRAMETEITEEERSFTIQGLINQYKLSDDQPLTDAMMDVYARLGGKKRSVDALIEAVQAVTIQDVQEVARTVKVDTIYFLRDEEGISHA
ncbi:EF-P 5-aminopentanol modification-associated protein YfmF [Ferroacidibacillus organovorans]